MLCARTNSLVVTSTSTQQQSDGAINLRKFIEFIDSVLARDLQFIV